MEVKHFHTVSALQKFPVTLQFPDNFDSSKKYPTWLVGHGIGERGRPLAHYNWWSNLRAQAAKEGIILAFVNTTGSYASGEYQYTLDFAKGEAPVDVNNIGVINHSLGGHGFFNYACVDPAFAKQLNTILSSSPGSFPANTPSIKNIVDYNIRVHGINAVQDTIAPVRILENLFNGVKGLRSDAKIMLTTLPATAFTYDKVKYPWAESVAEVAHAHVATRFTAAAVQPAINTKGVPTNLDGSLQVLRMNIYQWAKANPKGSKYQPPTEAYKGPVYDQPSKPTPAPGKVLRWINHNSNWNKQGDVVAQLVYSDGSAVPIKSPAGDRIQSTTISIYNQDILINYEKGADQSIKIALCK